MAGVTLPAQGNAFDFREYLGHSRGHLLVEIGALFSADQCDGQVQPGAGIETHAQSFHDFQVVDLARNQPAVGGNQCSERTGGIH